LLVYAIITIHDHGLKTALLAALLAALGALLSILDGDIRRCSPATAPDQVKLSHLIANSVLGSNGSPLLGGAPEGVGRCLKRL
jgi:hypothetical protein